MKKISHNKQNRNQQGFTIVELMIATTVFSVVLLLCTFGLIQVSRLYYKGVTESRTQEVARSVMDEIGQSIQFTGGEVVPTGTISDGVPYMFCVGDTRYSVLRNRQIPAQAPHGLVVDTLTGCSSTSAPQQLNSQSVILTSDSRELLAPDMRVGNLQVTSLGGDLYGINLVIIYGTDDLLDNGRCRSQFTLGSQFCAVSELNTVVQKRL